MSAPDILKDRGCMTALLYGHRTPRMEVATGGRVKGTGDLSLEDDMFTGLFNKRIGHRYR
jgi:hypothetical protein